MELNFRKLTIDDKKIYDRFLPYYRGYYGWEYSFSMTWIWNGFEKTEICDVGDMAFVSSIYFNKRIFYPPFVKDKKDLVKAVELVADYCKQNSVPLDLRGLTKEQASLLDTKKYSITTHEDNNDYVYSCKDLIELVGKKYHSKRNFVTRFKTTYPNYIFRAYDEKSDRNAIFDLFTRWQSTTCHETLAFEEKVIGRALDNAIALNLKIGVLYVENKLVAFSVIGNFNTEIAHTYFEKADKDYIGSFQAINQFAAKEFLSNNQFVNRQEDLGIEGLRKAKQSYNPQLLVEKYYVTMR